VSTFVSVGNATQPFSRLLDEVARLALTLPRPVIVQHGETPFLPDVCKVISFVEMSEFERLVAEAELLILHAGAGSLIHAIRAGKVPVVMPRRAEYGEHVDDHQIEFARALAAAGRVVVAYQPAQLGDAVRRALALQRSAGKVVADASVMLRLLDETLAGYARQFS
jgi:UDP-N-acetylglucosamine transferase subunit ALG13